MCVQVPNNLYVDEYSLESVYTWKVLSEINKMTRDEGDEHILVFQEW